jgi:hypothetical protein
MSDRPSSGAIARSEKRAFFRTPYGRPLLPEKGGACCLEVG